MRPAPRILLEAAVAAAASEYGGIVKHFSPPPLSTTSPPPTPPPCVSHACRWWPYSGSKEFEANAAMVLIILLSALICALGLNSAIRCFLRTTHIVDDEERNLRRRNSSPQELANMQLKTNAAAAPCFDGGPTVAYSPEMKAEMAGAAAECAICLSEFVDGEGIRVLERCKHGFHSHCIQAWLSSHSSCPTCRRTCLPPSPPPPPPPPPPQSAEVDQPPLPESTAP